MPRNVVSMSSDKPVGLVGHWRFDELGGLAFDTSGSANHGYIDGATRVAGQIGAALDFDGDNDLVNCGNNASINGVFDGGGTIMVWINPDSDGEGNTGRILYKKAASGFDLYTIDEAGGLVKLRFRHDFDGTDGQWGLNAADVPIGAWTNIAITYDNGSVDNNPIIYINSVAKTVVSGLTEVGTPVGTRVSDATSNLMVGNADAKTVSFDGTIDDVRIYNYVLTQAEIQKIYDDDK